MYSMEQGYKKNSAALKAVKILTPLFISIFLIIIAVLLALNAKFLYYWDIDHLKIAQSVNMDKATLIKNYDLLIKYTDLSSVSQLSLPDFKFSQDGLIHFRDVKHIFIVMEYFIPITLILSIIGIIICTKKRSISYLKWSSISLLLIPLILAIPFIINFNASFTKFHQLAFSNNYWELDPSTDPIINVLPEAFFMHEAFLILGLLVAFSIILYVIYRVLKRRQRT